MAAKTAEAVWNKDLKSGSGTMKLGSGVWEGSYSFASRFESGEGTNPEELIGAALAGCFSMAFSNSLAKAGFTPEKAETKAEVTLETTDNGPAITRILLTTHATVPDVDEATFQKIAEESKKGCPVSKALAGTSIELNATLG